MKNIFVAFSFLLLLYSCTNKEDFVLESRSNLKEIKEQKVVEIKLEAEASYSDAELSGLAWYKNYLILLPQFPYKFGDGLNGAIFYLPKQKIKRYISSKNHKPLRPKKLSIDATGLDKFNRLGSGYEGVIFNKDTVYFVLENYKEETEGFIVRGTIDFPNKKIKLNENSLKKIRIKNHLPNLSEETITYFYGELFTIHEINGINVNSNPVAAKFNRDLSTQTLINFPHLEYRVTDATAVAADSTFWAINYFWKGDTNQLKPQSDLLLEKFGIGKTHKNRYSVERLIKMKITPDAVKLVDEPPIYLELPPNTPSRNWEGIAKLDDLGFLIVTDKFPYTILGFVKYPLN